MLIVPRYRDFDDRHLTAAYHGLRTSPNTCMSSGRSSSSSTSSCAGDKASVFGKVDINTLLERPTSASSPGNASASSRSSGHSNKVKAEETVPMPEAVVDGALPPISGPPMEPPVIQSAHHPYSLMQSGPFTPYPPAPTTAFPPISSYPSFPATSITSSRLPSGLHISTVGPSNKRLAPHQPHPAESPAKKKQSKWSADEDASIIELRGNGMKWEDISKHLPGRSAISCRLRFQNYLERRSEWDEEKKNKLARLYERYINVNGDLTSVE
jgi:hypothetical protein